MAGTYTKRKLNNIKKWICSRPYYIRRWYNRKVIKSRDFTVISNNCWAGKLYQYLDMPYLTPTVGLYFFAKDYLKFIKDLHYYMSLELEFINAKDSRYFDILKQRNHQNVPIAKLGDIEIVFLHYKTNEEAKEKWNRRKKRINYENILIKFSNMNLCSEEDIEEFANLPFENKFVLNIRKKPKYNCECYWKGRNDGIDILSDTDPFPGNLCLNKLVGKNKEKYPENGFEGV